MIIDSEQMTRLLVEIGERTPQILSVIQDAGAAQWVLELEDDVVIIAELDANGGTLSIEADIGRPPEEHRLATCETLMMFTFLEHAGKGTAMALSEPEGNFQLCSLLTEPTLDIAHLGSTLLAFAEQARLWRKIVARGAQQVPAVNHILSPTIKA